MNKTKEESLIKGKIYELLNIDNSVMLRLKINYVKEEIVPIQNHNDGSVSPSRKRILVSEEGSGWFTLYGGKTDRIV